MQQKNTHPNPTTKTDDAHPKPKPAQQRQQPQKPKQQKQQQQQAKPTQAKPKGQEQNVKGQKEESKAQQVEQPKAEVKLQVSQTVKLTQLLKVFDEDKNQKKVSLILDETGNVFTFCKYKGEVIDISEYIVKEGLGSTKKEDNQERARKTVVRSLQIGGILVFFLDLGAMNLTEYFNGCSFFEDPSSLFNYGKLFKEAFYKVKILKKEEDVDSMGNKGGFYAKEDDFKMCILCNAKNQPDPDIIINSLGLASIKDLFRATIVQE